MTSDWNAYINNFLEIWQMRYDENEIKLCTYLLQEETNGSSVSNVKRSESFINEKEIGNRTRDKTDKRNPRSKRKNKLLIKHWHSKCWCSIK